MKSLYKITLLFALLVSTNSIFAQQTELQKGIDYYRLGKNNEAVAVLEKLVKTKNKTDEPVVLNFLGLAYIQTKSLKKARQVLEKAVELDPQNAVLRANLSYAYLASNKLNKAQAEAEKSLQIDPQFYMAYYFRGTSYLWEAKFDEALSDAEKSIALNGGFSSGYALKSDTLVALFGNRMASGSNAKNELEYLGKAVEALETCVKVCQNNPDLQTQREKIESLKIFYDFFNREKEDSLVQNPIADATTSPLKITYKPRLNYNDQARNSFVTGKIVVAVLFASTGKVTQTIVIKPLGYGLDQEAIRAARGIRFSPVLKNGKPVSVVKMVEYSFSIGQKAF